VAFKAGGERFVSTTAHFAHWRSANALLAARLRRPFLTVSSIVRYPQTMDLQLHPAVEVFRHSDGRIFLRNDGLHELHDVDPELLSALLRDVQRRVSF
jgi:hypothetical protein